MRTIGGSAARIGLLTDGTQRFDDTFGLARSAPVEFDVTGVFRIMLTATPSTGAAAAIGQPQVLCNY